MPSLQTLCKLILVSCNVCTANNRSNQQFAKPLSSLICLFILRFIDLTMHQFNWKLIINIYESPSLFLASCKKYNFQMWVRSICVSADQKVVGAPLPRMKCTICTCLPVPQWCRPQKISCKIGGKCCKSGVKWAKVGLASWKGPLSASALPPCQLLSPTPPSSCCKTPSYFIQLPNWN